MQYRYCCTIKRMKPKGSQAAQLRKRKFDILRRLELPAEALPGSLSLTHRRCGKSSCHCASGQGHPMWSLTFMVNGKKHVERVPAGWVEEVRRRVEQGREFKQAWADVLAANAQLLVLERCQRDKKKSKH
jgi:hypothetical protein